MNETLLENAASPPALATSSPTRTSQRRWNPVSVALIVLAWLILHLGGLFSPGLLDDVDSVYIEIAREMLQRHDLVTPYIDGIRFFDKPPLMYWLAAGSMHLFGIHDWAARLPLALLTLVLFLSIYALGLRLFAEISPATHPDRAALYSALAFATCLGPYLYTRFFIPDILLALWMTLGVHLFLIALTRAQTRSATSAAQIVSPRKSITSPASPTHTPDAANLSTAKVPAQRHITTAARTSSPSDQPSGPPSALLPMLAFAVVMALNVLTKGLIGLVFPLGFVLLYLALTRQLRLLPRLHPIAATATFLILAAPWHILAAIRNPAIALPPGLGLPARGGWAWFYLYNEHIARFLSRRIPHDYGQVPIPLFWLLALIWLLPWAAFLPAGIALHLRNLRNRTDAPPSSHATNAVAPTSRAFAPRGEFFFRLSQCASSPRQREAALTLLLWSALVLGFFTLSARQEYYSLPALPALALVIGSLLARADRTLPATPRDPSGNAPEDVAASRSANRASLWFLVPFGVLSAAVATFFAITAPHPAPGTDLASLLAANPDAYNLSLGHLFDLTGAAMGLFRLPLACFALSMLALGPVAWLIRRRGHTLAANLTLAAAGTALLLCVHVGLTRFYPTLGSKSLAEAILSEQHLHPTPAHQPGDLILIDGELTSGSTLLFYTGHPVHLVDGRINGPWYGSFWPDAPPIFETQASLHQLWQSPHRIFLLTDHPSTRLQDLPHAQILASAGGKSILTNHP